MSAINRHLSDVHQQGGASVALLEKQDYMDAAYTAIADVYDEMHTKDRTGLGLYGKRELIRLIAAAPGSKMLDMAAGTGDAAMLFIEYQETVNKDASSSVTLVDLNARMLDVAKNRLADTSFHKDGLIEYLQGNAEHMPEIADNSFDSYCCIFGLHNMPNRTRVLKEALRVLKPGGKICIGELNGGNGILGKAIYGTLNKYVFVPLSQWTQKDREMANRIRESVLAFPSPEDFANELRDAGFMLEGCGYHSLVFGLAVGFIGTKPI